MDFFRRLTQQLRDVWNGMGAALRVVLIVGVLLGLLLIGAVGYYSSQSEYRTLFSNLAPEDLQSIRDRLDQQKVSNRTGTDGTSILVPSDRVAALRVDLASQGVLTQTKGYELLDEPSLGSTPFRDSVNFLRAKQAELAKTIRGLEPVSNARVEIAKSEPSPFLRDQKPTTASVMVQLKQGASLSPKQVKGIVALVSKAVEGLAAENVTLVDGKGQVLSDSGEADMGAATSQLDYRRSLESYLASKAEGMLTKILGPGRVTVHVTADVNFKRLREMRETYNPEGKALRTEKTTSKKVVSTGGGGARGVAGAASNLPVRQAGAAFAAGGGGGGSSDNEETTETNYEVSRVRQELEDGLGSIERLSVAATVDLTQAEGSAASPAPLAKAEIERLIKQAVGYRQDRGDEIQVSETRLAVVPPPKEPETPAGPTAEVVQMEKIQYWVNIGNKVALGLAVLLLAVAVALALPRLARRSPEPAPAAAAPPLQVRERVVDRLTTVAQRDPEALARALAAMMERP